MIKPRFFAGEHFSWYGRKFEVIRGLPTEEIIVRDTKTMIIVTVDFTEIVMQYVLQKLNAQKTENKEIVDYPSALMAVAQFRKNILDLVLKMPVHHRYDEIQRLVERIRAEPRSDNEKPIFISVATIYRWLREYEKSGRNIHSLIPATSHRGGSGKSRLPDAVEHILWGVIEENRFTADKGAAVTEVLHMVNARIREENRRRSDDQKLPIVSRATVGRRMQGKILE